MLLLQSSLHAGLQSSPQEQHDKFLNLTNFQFHSFNNSEIFKPSLKLIIRATTRTYDTKIDILIHIDMAAHCGVAHAYPNKLEVKERSWNNNV